MKMERSNCNHPDTTPPTPAPDLDRWLNMHPRIARAIGWVDANHKHLSYLDWSAKKQNELAEAFRNRWIQKPTTLEDPPPNALKPEKCSPPETALGKEYAWPLYLTHVANGLAIEIKREVNWSLARYSKANLEILFDSEHMFSFGAGRLYHLDWKKFGKVVPAPPDLAYRFVRPMVSRSRLETICRLIDWCANLQHYVDRKYYIDPFVTGNMELTWGYDGLPPVSRIIGRTVADRSYELIEEVKGLRSWTAGCWGTSGFLRAVLRTVNIPVTLVTEGSESLHALPYFPTEKRYLSHGDDPYNPRLKGIGLPSRDLLICEEDLGKWFGDRVPKSTQEKNIGRQVSELEIRCLPEHLVRLYIDDIKSGVELEKSEIAKYFVEDINYLELKFRFDLWTKLKERRELWGM